MLCICKGSKHKILKEEPDKDYLPFDHGLLEVVVKKIRKLENRRFEV
jgi:hypothetical protein